MPDIIPFRHRHDGWTPARQREFLEALRSGGCVVEACRQVGLSTTSAYRTRRRLADFAAAWDLMLEYRAPLLERAAFTRAVEGWLDPIVHRGEIVGYRRRYSDALLRLLLVREDARAAKREEERASAPHIVTEEETDAALLRQLAILRGQPERECEREAEEASYHGGEFAGCPDQTTFPGRRPTRPVPRVRQ